MPVREVTCAAELAPDTKTAANDQKEMQRKVSGPRGFGDFVVSYNEILTRYFPASN